MFDYTVRKFRERIWVGKTIGYTYTYSYRITRKDDGHTFIKQTGCYARWKRAVLKKGKTVKNPERGQK
jgi:hypothetical protein